VVVAADIAAAVVAVVTRVVAVAVVAADAAVVAADAADAGKSFSSFPKYIVPYRESTRLFPASSRLCGGLEEVTNARSWSNYV
jgi:hypothetical protein